MTLTRIKRGPIEFLQFNLLAPFQEISHGVFTRRGGFSSPPYASLNTSLSVGDAPPNVKKNLKALQEALGIPSLAMGRQVHDTNIYEVTTKTPLIFKNCDGLITKEKGIGLLIHHADCQAALFYDPIEKIIGCAHAGWKGNVKRLYTKMVQRFRSLGSDPKNIFVCISPSLGPDHAEFINYQTEFPPEFWPFQVKENTFDLWAIAKKELIDSGIAEKHIAIASICTVCARADFFSFRRSQITGRNGSVIALNC